MNQTIEVRPTNGAVGAELHGIDLSRGVSPEQAQAIKAALAEHGVVFFRDQQLTPEEHIAFAEAIGTININRFFAHVPEHPQIAEVRKERDQIVNIGGGWHTDHSYDLIPALGSILVARDLPERGGDTMFSSMWLAYEGLSEGLKRTLDGMRAVHSSAHVFGAKAEYSASTGGRLGNADLVPGDVVHPVVIRHPESGRKVLYVNPAFTIRFDGWTQQESAGLLAHLYEQAKRPEYTTRFRWEPGSVAFWDNRSTWHLAVNDYHGQFRLMHRITLEGTPLPAAV